MDQTLQGKVALITGGGTGIGYAAAQSLVERGAFVYITGRRIEPLEQAASELGELARGIAADVTSKSEMDRVAERIKADKGRVDIVFANAGIGSYLALDKITEEHFDATFDTNVKGTLFTVQAVLPILSDGASIILNTSITAELGLPNFSVYAAAKAALRSFVHSWATDLKGRRIRVNAVSPGVIPTDAATGELGRTPEQEEQHQQRVAGYVPLGRVGTTREIGEAVAFLASNQSSYVNGIELTVDGGMTSAFAGTL
jgi:NAD(P)-dependent dehydrogenase (short-subunit alcohol dehydrogenase family)